jgi:hypothetical protein
VQGPATELFCLRDGSIRGLRTLPDDFFYGAYSFLLPRRRREADTRSNIKYSNLDPRLGHMTLRDFPPMRTWQVVWMTPRPLPLGHQKPCVCPVDGRVNLHVASLASASASTCNETFIPANHKAEPSNINDKDVSCGTKQPFTSQGPVGRDRQKTSRPSSLAVR